MKTVLFVCEANARRSQIAEWLYNHQYKGRSFAKSIAGSKARKKEHNGKTAQDIAFYIKNSRWIDITQQNISYITDLSEEELPCIDKVIFLYNPVKEDYCEEICKINGQTPYHYFKENWRDIQIIPVLIPDEIWIIEFQKVIDKIQEIISEI